MKKIVFVDRDGTIVREPRDEQVDSLEKLEFVPGIISGLKLLVESGYTLIMVSNQDGLGSKRYPRKSFRTVQKKILDLLEGEGIQFESVHICPHMPDARCECRKPKFGLVKEYATSTSYDRERSFVLGDRVTDVRFAHNLGIQSVLLSRSVSKDATYNTSSAFDACQYIAKSGRSAHVERKTGETEIAIDVSIDGSGIFEVSTGIGFFDHMLSQLAKHSGVDTTIEARGDLAVDEHHTVEDVGIALGTAIRNALGDKRGIERFAAPLDEALATVVLDLSGRSYLSFRCKFNREFVGKLPTELVEDFFHAFADGLKATLHIECKGRNDHHKIEAMFKAVGRALKAAVAVDPRASRNVPSTKGLL
jgi:histidinol-phosphate phosphatase family domain/HAD-superfamily hydrolase, subfamily IIIA